MFKLKWGIFPAIGGIALAFIISLLIGHTGFLIALLRAGLFGALFFGLGAGTWLLISTFIPELLIKETKNSSMDSIFNTETAGSRINITVEDTEVDTSNAALPDSEREASGPEEVGDFNDLVVGAILSRKDVDQSPAAEYNDNDTDTEGFAPMFDNTRPDSSAGGFSMDFSAFTAGSVEKGSSSDPFGGIDAGIGLETSSSDSLMDSFSLFPSASDSGMFDEEPEPVRKPTGNKNAKLEGDFNAKEIAAGLRTVLEKDKKR